MKQDEAETQKQWGRGVRWRGQQCQELWRSPEDEGEGGQGGESPVLQPELWIQTTHPAIKCWHLEK